MLEHTGYVWRATPPEGFWNADTLDLIEYSEAAGRIVPGGLIR